MRAQHGNGGRKAGRGGFTLVEMAVVLVIIGVILGAVMIGRDVQRNAEYTRIKQKFVDQWVVAYNTYGQRLGAPIGNNQSAPRLMVNGANYTGTGGTLSGGDMSGVTLGHEHRPMPPLARRSTSFHVPRVSPTLSSVSVNSPIRRDSGATSRLRWRVWVNSRSSTSETVSASPLSSRSRSTCRAGASPTTASNSWPTVWRRLSPVALAASSKVIAFSPAPGPCSRRAQVYDG